MRGKADREKWLNYFWVVRLVARIGLKSSGKDREPGPFADDCLWIRMHPLPIHTHSRSVRDVT